MSEFRQQGPISDVAKKEILEKVSDFMKTFGSLGKAVLFYPFVLIKLINIARRDRILTEVVRLHKKGK